MYIYRTYFNLVCPVIDIDAAKQFLLKENMTKYLKSDNRTNKAAQDIKSIIWVLKNEDSGYIELESNNEIQDSDLDIISDWVKGQNSDGIGESFEQQDFACYCSHDTPRYWEYDEEWEAMAPVDDREWFMASFDWKTNDYKFELYQIV